MTNNQFAVYAFLMNTAYNLICDKSEEPWLKRLGKAALNSIPMSIAIDTKSIVNYAADRCKIKEVNQPRTSLESLQKVLGGSSSAIQAYVEDNNMPAYYSKPENSYKNLA